MIDLPGHDLLASYDQRAYPTALASSDPLLVTMPTRRTLSDPESVSVSFRSDNFLNLPLQRGEFIESDVFQCQGRKWRLRAYPHGHEKSKRVPAMVGLELIILPAENGAYPAVAFIFYLNSYRDGSLKEGKRSCVIENWLARNALAMHGHQCIDASSNQLMVMCSIRTIRNIWFPNEAAGPYRLLRELFTSKIGTDICFELPSGEKILAHESIIAHQAPGLYELIKNEGSRQFDEDGRIVTHFQVARIRRRSTSSPWISSDSGGGNKASGDPSSKRPKKKKQKTNAFDVLMKAARVPGAFATECEIFKSLIKFLYTGELALPCPEPSNVPHNDMNGKIATKTVAREMLLREADRLGCETLKLRMESEMVAYDLVVAENVSRLLLFAEAHSCPLLKEAALHALEERPDEISKTPGWKMVEESPALMTQLIRMSFRERPSKRFERFGGEAKVNYEDHGDSDDDESISDMKVGALRDMLDRYDQDLTGTKEMLVSRMKMIWGIDD